MNDTQLIEAIRLIVREELTTAICTGVIDAWNSHIQVDTVGIMRAASTLRSAEFVRHNIPLHLGKTHLALRRDAVLAAAPEGLFLEFGVWKGYWINEMARVRPDVKFFGFDSFEGLPEPWEFRDRGAFGLDGIMPVVEANVTLIKGWFDQTLCKFLDNTPDMVSFAHIDCDLYTSTITVLETLRPRMRIGTQIVFDDFMVAPNWEFEEHKAFFDFVKRWGIKYEYTGWSNQAPACSAGIVITCI